MVSAPRTFINTHTNATKSKHIVVGTPQEFLARRHASDGMAFVGGSCVNMIV